MVTHTLSSTLDISSCPLHVLPNFVSIFGVVQAFGLPRKTGGPGKPLLWDCGQSAEAVTLFVGNLQTCS